ncbi:MAG: hypothetical protein F6K16_32430 [Symploca sp. SIO2B6]|nr:hypothetical protein [Symploca sp. SIO2B6]
MITDQYQVGGSLATDHPSYVVRRADTELYEALKVGRFCYVLNSRQMGKSSILVRTRHLLQQEGYRCTAIDMTRIGSENITADQWYKGVVAELWRGFGLFSKVKLKTWWQEQNDVSVLQRLSNFIEDVVLAHLPDQHLVIFIDEIDSTLSLDFAIDDFFGLIRFCYNQRAVNPAYQRLTFAIFGVAAPTDLIQDRQRTPFNIGKAIALHGFTLEEAKPLAQGFGPYVGNPGTLLKEILIWTGGQPFLTQKLCRLMLDSIQQAVSGDELVIPPGTEEFWVESVVRSLIIHKWESNDEPEHLRTIRDRLDYDQQNSGRLLGIYQKILENTSVPADDSREHTELLLSGLVVKFQGVLQARNPIYQEIFNLEWVARKLSNLRPYSQSFDAWIAAEKCDPSRLLRGQALKDAQTWAQGKSLSNLDYQFLADSQAIDRREVQQALEAARTSEAEARLCEEHRRLAIQAKNVYLQRFLLTVVSVALVMVTGLGGVIFFQYRKALNHRSTTHSDHPLAKAHYADNLRLSHQPLEALQSAIHAAKTIQRQPHRYPLAIEQQVQQSLHQTLSSAIEKNRFSGHHAPIYQAIFSPDGTMIASASWDKTVQLWKRDGTLHGILEHEVPVRNMAFGPDNTISENILASASDKQAIKLWDITNGALIQTLSSPSSTNALHYHPNGRWLLCGGDDGTLRIWDIEQNSLSQTITAHNRGVTSVQYAPNGKQIVSTSDDGMIKIWSSAGNLLYSFQGHDGAISHVAFSPDSQRLVMVGADQTIRLWAVNGEPLHQWTGHGDRIHHIRFSPDGQTLASASQDHTIKLWTLDGALMKTLQGHQAGVWSIDFSPDSQTLLSASDDATVRLWQLNNPLLTAFGEHPETVSSIDVHPDGEHVASGSWDHTVRLWTLDGQLQQTFDGHRDRVTQVDFHPGGDYLVTASWDGTAKLWDLEGKLLQSLGDRTKPLEGVAFSPDGQTVASSSWDTTIKLWDLEGQLQRTLEGHSDRIYDIAFHPYQPYLLSGSWDQTLKLWHVDGTLLTTMEGHNAPIWAVEFSPDGQWIASASADGVVKLWSDEGTLQLTLEGHTQEVTALTFSPDGQWMASSSVDQTVTLWPLPELLSLLERPGIQDYDIRVGFSGTLELINDKGQTITTEHLTELPIQAWADPSGTIQDIQFSPKGRLLLTAGEGRVLNVWQVNQPQELDDLIVQGCQWIGDYLNHNVAVDERDRYLCDDVLSERDAR